MQTSAFFFSACTGQVPEGLMIQQERSDVDMQLLRQKRLADLSGPLCRGQSVWRAGCACDFRQFQNRRRAPADRRSTLYLAGFKARLSLCLRRVSRTAQGLRRDAYRASVEFSAGIQASPSGAHTLLLRGPRRNRTGLLRRHRPYAPRSCYPAMDRLVQYGLDQGFAKESQRNGLAQEAHAVHRCGGHAGWYGTACGRVQRLQGTGGSFCR